MVYRHQQTAISIHALREEGDECRVVLPHQVLISIHALREEGDTITPLYTIYQ